MRAWLPALLIIAAVGAFDRLTIRAGQDWGDDFALYVLHAKNLAQGVDYARTGFIYNPAYPNITWREPPVFPLLLAPVVRARGVDLRAMQVEVAWLFTLTLAAIALAFKPDLSAGAVAAVMAIVGFNFYFWDATNQVRADIPFILSVYLCLYLCGLVYRSGIRERREGLAAAIAGVAILAAYGTRTVGIVLLPTALIVDAIKFRRITRFQAGVMAVFIAGAALQARWLGDAVNYDVKAFVEPLGVFTNVPVYAGWLIFLWTASIKHAMTIGPLALVGFLAVWGFASRRRSLSHAELYFVLHGLVISVWGEPELRQLLPLAPLYVFYVFVGLSRLSASRPGWIRQIAPALVAVAMLAPSARRYARTDMGPLSSGVETPASRELFAFVKTTPADSVVIFRKPRALTLFTGRAASVYDVAQTGQDLTEYMRAIHATHVIESSIFPEDARILHPYIERHAETLRLVFVNGDFRVFEVRR